VCFHYFWRIYRFRFLDLLFFHYLAADQRVFTWGSNEVGQLGTGQDVKCQTQAKEVTSLAGKPLEHVSCGYDSTFVWVSAIEMRFSCKFPLFLNMIQIQ
jgi:hypothetical protein